jgi:prevent-host-death family protein
MAEIGVEELKSTASAVIAQVEAGRAFVVTKRGRPAAVLMPIDEAETFVLANSDTYARMRRVGRAADAKGRTTSLEGLV